ncbi:radical SAM-associated putative lipoprotein [Treponema sp. R80B11-R83G3]
MVKLSDRSRRVLRRIYQGLGAATVSILFQACYGMPMDDVTISGTVTSKTDNPIPDIKVSVENFSSCSTDSDGKFNIYAYGQASYNLLFEDVDGPLNGSYKTLEKTISLNEADTPLNIQLEADEE